jgi:uncharacterized membrane protein
LISSVSLAVLSSYGSVAAVSQTFQIFLALVSYVLAASLISVGTIHQVASRYLADRLYENKPEFFAPAFTVLLTMLLTVQAVCGSLFFCWVPLTIDVLGAALVLLLAVSATWLAMTFLSAAKDYRTIVSAFLLGGVVAVTASLFGGQYFGLKGLVLGFTSGYLFTLAILMMRVMIEFGLPLCAPDGLREALVTFWPLTVAGFAYNLGVWIDKILCWYHPKTGVVVAGALHIAPIYDNAMFLAYASIIPAMGLFLLRVETDFYDTYRDYFSTLLLKGTLTEIEQANQRLRDTLWRNVVLLLKLQAPITVLMILFAPEIFSALKLNWASIFVFRFGALGAFFHALHLMIMILLLYLEYRIEAMALALVFFVTNTVFTLLTFNAANAYLGIGYSLSCGFTFVFGLLLLLKALDDLDFHVFVRQPLL